MNKNDIGEIPLHLACKYEENGEIVKALLDCNAEKQKQQLEAQNAIFGNTPLHIVACQGNTDIAHVIIKECCVRKETLTEVFKIQNKLSDTPVHGAAAKNHSRFPWP